LHFRLFIKYAYSYIKINDNDILFRYVKLKAAKFIFEEEIYMKIGVTEISPRTVQQVAEKKFKEGYYCCEALVSAIRDEFKLDVPEEVIAMASGMAVGRVCLWCF